MRRSRLQVYGTEYKSCSGINYGHRRHLTVKSNEIPLLLLPFLAFYLHCTLVILRRKTLRNAYCNKLNGVYQPICSPTLICRHRVDAIKIAPTFCRCAPRSWSKIKTSRCSMAGCFNCIPTIIG